MVSLFLRLYHLFLSPIFHAVTYFVAGAQYGCRFSPSCSEYASEAIERFGLRTGGWMAFKRFMKCNPWGAWGYDPVPRELFPTIGIIIALGFGVFFSQDSVAAPLVLENKEAKITLGNGPALIQQWELKHFTRAIEVEKEQYWNRNKTDMKDDDSVAVDLHYVTNLNDPQVSLAFNDPAYNYLEKVEGTWVQESEGKATWTYEDDKVRLKRKVSLGESDYFINLQHEIEFKQSSPQLAYVLFNVANGKSDAETIDRFIYFFQEGSTDYRYVYESSFFGGGGALPTGGVDLENKATRWVSAVNRYFVLALAAGSSSLPEAGIYGRAYPQDSGKAAATASLVYKIDQGQKGIRIPVKVFFGPKDTQLLARADETLSETVDFGVFSFIALPFQWILKSFYSFLHNYGLAIILLTLLVKITLFPLVYKSSKSMKAMQEIQPKINRLKDKYGNDKQALNLAMMQLFRDNGVNPLSGCLPMLLQIPVFFALYKVLYVSVELYQAPFALWLQDLSARDPYYIMPVLVCLTWWAQQLITPVTVTDPMQKRMLQMMPLIFGVMMITMPQGLGLYFLVNAVTSIFQQAFLNKKLGINIKSDAVAQTS